MRALKGFRALPAWGQVAVLCSIGLGAGTGAGIAGIAKVVGIQSAAQAAADKAELKADIGAGVQRQQTADKLAEARDAEFKKTLETIQAAQSTQGAQLKAIARQLSKRARVATETP